MAKNRYSVICVLFLIASVATSFQSPSITQVYLSQVGKVEAPRGSNWGPDVKGYLAATKTRTPAPWCAAFVRWCLDSAGIKTSITAWSPTAHNKNNLVYARAKLLQPTRGGDVFTIYYAAMGRVGHTGFIHRSINSAMVETVEGNSNDGGSREGYGVFRRKRSLHTLWSITRWD